jgi:MFS family permease
MSKWTIEEQEKVVKASLVGALFVGWLTALFLLEELTLRWFGLVRISDAIGVSVIIPLIYYFRQLLKNPKVLSYGWRLRELCGEFQDEYLRSRFQQATTLAFQLMMFAAFFGYVGGEIVTKFGDPAWLSYKMVPLLVIVSGNLSFYLSLRNVLDVQDDAAEPLLEQSSKDNS